MSLAQRHALLTEQNGRYADLLARMLALEGELRGEVTPGGLAVPRDERDQ